MANSKSTIYPVQLQGAELNLNKLDAEIKQYSGFNKNNSPFVGGCLSNVFIKNSALEDHNDSNTYIAENGDVYTVTTEGLFKNSEKLEDYTGKDFIAVEKINAPRDCVKAFAEDLFLRIVNENVFLNDIQLFDAEIKRLVDTETFITKYSCGVWVGSVFVFAFWGRWRGYMQNKLFLVALEKNESGEYEILKRNDQSFRYDWDISSVSYESPIAILATEDSGRTYIQVTFFSGYTTVSSRNHYAYFDDSGVYFESSVDTVSGVASAYAAGWTYNSSAANINGTGKYKVNLLSYPRNELVYDWLSFKDNSTTEQAKKTAIRISLNVKENFENLGNGYVLKDANVLQTLPAPGSGTPYTEQNASVYVKSKLFDSSILRCCGIVVEKDSGTYFENLGTPFCVGKDEDDNYITVGGSTVLLDNCPFGVLLNNGVVSGIAACQAGSANWAKNNCTTKILVTNWNTVKESLITYIPEEGTSSINLIYGDYDGNFFILKRTDVPTLKRVNNQIVTNVLYNHNSYFLDRQESGYFAPGFNVSAIKNDNLLYLGSSNYKAASINEYKLEDNASILLNPFESFANTSGVEVQMFAKVNVYTGSPDCKYWYSFKIINGSQIMQFTDTELQGLSFPIDTSGNVSYSPSLFSEIVNVFGNRIMIKENKTLYFLQVYNNEPVMSFYMAGGIENISDSFIIQGQCYVILDNSIYSFQFENGVSGSLSFIVDVSNLQFVGNTPYEALFFSKTNRCLYSFTGANVLNQKQLIDKISEVRNYLYNPATQTVFLITDIGVLFYGLFGIYLLEFTDISKIFLLENGIVMSDNNGNYRYIKYYLDEGDTDYVKENINIETCFYGMNNEVVTINDCLYFRLFSEEHEEGDLKVSATTISLSGRKTEETTFKIKASDWDKITHTIYLRYQPKAQRGLGVSFSINSPFKIASLSVGSQPDAVLVDKVSKGAITAPQQTSNNIEW